MREQLTEGDVKKIQEEIEYRKLVVRKEAIEAVKEARAHGDLSENFEYHAAKKDKNINESRIRYLERMLKTANVITDHSKADEVGLDKTVEVYCEDDDETETYRIVTSVRGNSLSGLISIESPLGKALMGHKVGDRVYIKVNEQFGYYVEIRSISEAAGEEEDQIRKFEGGVARNWLYIKEEGIPKRYPLKKRKMYENLTKNKIVVWVKIIVRRSHLQYRRAMYWMTSFDTESILEKCV